MLNSMHSVPSCCPCTQASLQHRYAQAYHRIGGAVPHAHWGAFVDAGNHACLVAQGEVAAQASNSSYVDVRAQLEQRHSAALHRGPSMSVSCLQACAHRLLYEV